MAHACIVAIESKVLVGLSNEQLQVLLYKLSQCPDHLKKSPI